MILKEVTCCNCGIVFGIGSGRVSDLRASHAYFYCPSGHQQSYTADTDVERERTRANKLAEMLDHTRTAKAIVVG